MDITQKQKDNLAAYISEYAGPETQINRVLVGYTDNAVDVVWLISGRLYDAETRALSIMTGMRSELGMPFDLMVLPESSYKPERFQNYSTVFSRG